MLPPFQDFGESLALIVLAAILCWVGSAMSQGRPAVEMWAKRLSVGTFLFDGLLYVAAHSDPTIGTCLAGAIHGLIVAFAGTGAFLIMLSIVAALSDALSRLSERSQRLARLRNEERERAEKEYRDADERRRRDEEWERTRPEREQQQREVAERQALERQLKSADQKRREDARLRCETLFSLQAPIIKKRFDKAKFDAFVTTYMGDARPAMEVEERAEQLTALITQHVQAVAPQGKQVDLSELATWYVAEKEKLESLPIDDEVKDDHRIRLETRYAELIEELLEKIRP